jgi:SHS2 domain-containing protein
MAKRVGDKKGQNAGGNRYRLLDHTSDLRIEIFGRGKEGLFISAGEALTDLLVGIEKVGIGEGSKDEVCRYEVIAEGDALEELLVDWLRELLYIFTARGKLFSTFDIEELTENRIRAFCSGEEFDIEKQGIKTEIKAVTYHGLQIKVGGAEADVDGENGLEKYTAKIIFDV